MFRLLPAFLIGAWLLATSALAQQRLDPNRLVRIKSPPKHAGTVDVTTGRWMRTSASTGVPKRNPRKVYDNTCTWQGGGYYAGFELCEDNYDEGRVPSPSSPGAPAGATVDQEMLRAQISYCTLAGPLGATGYDMDVAFYDKLLGNCVGFVAPTPPHPSITATAYFALAGLGLPGSTAVGSQACWIVDIDVSNTGWTMASDGEGTFDNDPVEDNFVWMQRQNTWASPLGYPSASPDGFIISGEPDTSTGSGGYGSCTYTIPCGTDAVFGTTCGTGLGAWDGSWINVDGIAAGDTSGTTPSGCPNAVSQYGFGTNCYFFGGYPTNPLASYWLTLTRPRHHRGNCGQANSCGNNDLLQQTTTNPGTFDMNNGESWNITLTGVPAAPNPAIAIYNTLGTLASPIATSFGNLCLSPFFRAASTATVPNSTAGGCSTPSQYDINMGAFADANEGGNGLVAGNSITIQLWHRDPPNPGTANFTNTTSSPILLL